MDSGVLASSGVDKEVTLSVASCSEGVSQKKIAYIVEDKPIRHLCTEILLPGSYLPSPNQSLYPQNLLPPKMIEGDISGNQGIVIYRESQPCPPAQAEIHRKRPV